MKYKLLLLFIVALVVTGCSGPPSRSVNEIQRAERSDSSIAWTLSTGKPIGVAVVSSDSDYSFEWGEQPTKDGATCWDTISVTLREEDGGLCFRYRAELSQRGGTVSSAIEGSDRLAGISDLVFSDVRTKGPARIGDKLGSFSFTRPGGSVVSGFVTVVSLDRIDTQQGTERDQ